MMNVRVRFFASYRERAKQEMVTLEVPEGSTVADLRYLLCQRFPGLPAPERLVVAVNAEYADPARILADNDEAALIPPVSGGAP